MAVVTRPPLVAYRKKAEKRAADSHLGPINLNLIGQDRFFGAPGQAPRYDWPVPRVAPRDITLRTWLNASTALLSSAAAAPFVQDDWPVPSIAKRSDSLRTHLDPVKTNLIGQDTFFGAPGQVQDFHWPVYRGPVLPAPTLALNLLETTLLPIPFVQSDWPLPTIAKRSDSLRTHLDPVKTNLIGQDTFFGAPGQVQDFHWPVYRGPVPPVPSFALNLLETTLLPLPEGEAAIGQTAFRRAVPAPFDQLGSPEALIAVPPAPFAQDDWPLPAIAKRSDSLRTHVDPVRLNLIGQDTFFGAPGQVQDFHWPVYRGTLSPAPSQAQNLLETTLLPLPDGESAIGQPAPRRSVPSSFDQLGSPEALIAVPPAPFTQDDWPLPAIAKRSDSLRTHVDPVRLNLIGQDTFFGAPGQVQDYQWQVYRGPLPAALSYAQNLLETTLMPLPEGETAIGQPAPRRSVPSSFDQLGSPEALLSPPAPFVQDDWPLPAAAKRSRAAPGHVYENTLALVTASRPFAQMHWPVPRRPEARACGFVDSFDLPAIAGLPFSQNDLRAPYRKPRTVAPHCQVNLLESTLRQRARTWATIVH